MLSGCVQPPVMRKLPVNLFLAVLIFVFASCEKAGSEIAVSSPALSNSSSPGNPDGSGNPSQAGVVTAGEWNDLGNWEFWNNLLSKDPFKTYPAYWSFFPNNRVSVNVVGTDSKPVVDAPVYLKQDGRIIYKSKTDNSGNAELWADLFQNNPNTNVSSLSIDVNNGSATKSTVRYFKDGVNKIVVAPSAAAKNIDIAFVVDATGSMGDEIEFLKTELYDVISRVKNNNPAATVSTSSVFYRDQKDEYVTKVSNFTTDINSTINFIKAQSANGGDDFPEAVHSGLDKAINELQWSPKAKARILFLILDAPPHHDQQVIQNIHTSIQKASEKGIKIIPITASGIDKETEFLMRFLSISTNGTYVFITNHSGVGGDHIEASVGEYEVEYLNNLMVRLINEYTK
jgi:von Willebrand factor type A domain